MWRLEPELRPGDVVVPPELTSPEAWTRLRPGPSPLQRMRVEVEEFAQVNGLMDKRFPKFVDLHRCKALGIHVPPGTARERICEIGRTSHG